MGPEDAFLRDALAIDRTTLANERTLLSYLRTALALLAAGGSLIHFVDGLWATLTGALLVALGPIFAGTGVWRFRRVRRTLRAARQTLARTR